MNPKHLCPSCGASEFITEPNQYEVLTFTDKGFQVLHNEYMYDYRIFCRECSAEVEEVQQSAQVVLKNDSL